MPSLTGRVALVTGSSRGIGRSIALALASSGADVAINYLRRTEEAKAVEEEIRRLGRRSIAIQADVSSAPEVTRLIQTIEAQLGPIDVLINNAGIARPQPIDAIAESDWDEILDANLKSCFLVTQAVLPAMRSRGWGRIVNLSSVAAHVGGVIGPHYAASKAGMLGLTHYYARHLAKEGITVNAISPALIETEMVTSNPNASPNLIPTGRFGTPDEVASAAVMLAENGYITGQTIHVNGGWFMT
ncbi:MAG TPA: 3-oxoacyl-ACP reductase family protein [Acidobacteriaceae bacterium]|nr:3-oxoacyl-ACP reductase family protein [Acidobacteriaceae bacterium]